MISDNELMLKIAGGDIDKIGSLYERYNKLLFGYFFKLTRNQELSEDFVNDVFLKILNSKNKYRGDGIFRVWMFRIARNVFIDNYNRRKKIAGGEEAMINESMHQKAEDSHTMMEKSETCDWLHRGLMKLKEKDREVLVLCKLEELTYREVAKILDCSEEAVRVRMFRALQNLKEKLAVTNL